ncbi:MAG: hypothetical protein HC822_12250 [Oscillochloris sp.]|nr:hypothetical protein [Oscillochloris sp.]
MSDYTTIEYRDELLPDKSVRRAYSDGTYEWRRRMPDGRIEWQDSRGLKGIDELLGDRVIKRLLENGQIIYGRDQGFGRTAWSNAGNKVLTINQTSFGGQVGAALAGVGAGMMLGAVVWPPDMLSGAEEEALRQAARDSSSPSGGDGGGSDSGWTSDGDDGGDTDFG